MKPNSRLLAALVLLAVAACRPGVAEYTESEAPKRLMLDNATAQVDLRFAPGSNRLVVGDAARLRALAATGAIAPADRVTVAVAGGPGLAAARFETIAAELLRYRIVATPARLAPMPPNHAVIEAARHLVALPPCPNWSKQASLDFTNTLPSNYGCADAVNLGLSVATPTDLIEPRPVAMADGQPAAAAVNRYLNDRVRLPTAAALGPIAAAAAAGTPAAPTGNGSQ